MRPTRWQWVVLWLGALWTLAVLALAEDYVARGVFAGMLVTGLLYWQLSPRSKDADRRPIDTPIHTRQESQQSPAHSDDVALSGPDENKANRAPDPVGVSGWLALFAFGVLVTPLIAILTAVEFFQTFDGTPVAWFTLALLAALASFSTYVLIGLVKHWPTAPRNAAIFIVIVLLLSIFASNVGEQSQRGSNAGGSFVWALIWGLYFKNSRRVKATYRASAMPQSLAVPRLAALCVGLFLVLIGVVQNSLVSSDVEAFEKLSPFQFVKFARVVSRDFDKEFADSSGKSLTQSLGIESLRAVTPTAFNELPGVIRSLQQHNGTMKLESGEVADVVVSTRQYFHASGIAILQSLCFPEVVNCDSLDKLAVKAESALLPRLADSTLTGVLPNGDCAVETPPDLPNELSGVETIACSYREEGGAALSLAKIPLDQSRGLIQSGNISRKSKREIVLASRR